MLACEIEVSKLSVRYFNMLVSLTCHLQFIDEVGRQYFAACEYSLLDY